MVKPGRRVSGAGATAGSSMPSTSTSSLSLSSSSLTSTSSVLEQLQQLRSFVGQDHAFTESDLSSCLREARYNVHLAAERLITGTFQPSKKNRRPSPSSSPFEHERTSSSSSWNAATNNGTKTKKGGSGSYNTHSGPSTAAASATPSKHVANRISGSNSLSMMVTGASLSVVQKKSPPPPPQPHRKSLASSSASTFNSSSSKSSSSVVNPVTPKTPVSVAPSTSTDHQKNSIDDCLLLCQRWISDGINLTRNGSCDYQETLHVPEPMSSSSFSSSSMTTHQNKTRPILRFRSVSGTIQGQFPKHLSHVLGPLLATRLIKVTAHALMEQKHLNTGAHVALSVNVWIANPRSFFQLFDKETNNNINDDVDHLVSNSKHFFQTQQRSTKSNGSVVGAGTALNSSTKSNNQGKRTLVESAFQLLQWAQYGTPLEELIELTASSESDDHRLASAVAPENVDENDSINDDGTTEEEEQAVPDWAQSVVEQQQEWKEMEKPDGFKVDLRPYQKQALYWMTQRERNSNFDNNTKGRGNTEDDTRSDDDLTAWKAKQIKLLRELAQSADSAGCGEVDVFRQGPPKAHEDPILCECGPVRVDTERVQAPSVLDMANLSSLLSSSLSSLAHPLWERRFLTNAAHDRAYSFFVQPFLGKATATPPPPPAPCRGGLLSDCMGLGKTVMLLALVQSSKQNDLDSTKEMPHNNATLVVTPLSLLSQWQEEIATKTTLSSREFYGDSKQQTISSSHESVDVVLTTYGTLQAELCRQRQNGNGQPGWLLKQRWKRVIIDEAHQIKNHNTAVSRACCQVQAERRWCVSGTIIQNSLDDVYALLRFLRHEPWCEHGFWKAAITKVSDLGVALDRVKRVLMPIMLRRTKDSVDKNGNPILTLPEIDYQAVEVHFTHPERQFYEALYKKSLDIFSGFINAGTASSSWLKIFSLLHRLRQTCSHVALTVRAHVNEDEWTSQIVSQKQDDLESGSSRLATRRNDPNGGSIDPTFLDGLHSQFKAMQESIVRRSGEKDGDDYALNVVKMLNDAVRNKESILKDECSICLENLSINDSVVTPCLHMFCKICLTDSMNLKASSEHREKTCSLKRCPFCNEQFDTSKILRFSQTQGGKFETQHLYGDSEKLVSSSVAKRFKDASSNLEYDNARETLQTALQGSSSSKLQKIQEELEKIWTAEPGSKVLIFSQFLGFLDLMERVFADGGIQTWRLDGKLSLKERMAVLKEFGSHTETKADADDGDGNGCPIGRRQKSFKKGSILLISMKAGGVGLNLVSARSVFIVDPWWNQAIEDQCINRIHRIGQLAKRVYVRKFYVSNSIEERIMELQQRKKSLASAALCDHGDSKGDESGTSRLSMDDFKLLFQPNVDMENGNAN